METIGLESTRMGEIYHALCGFPSYWLSHRHTIPWFSSVDSKPNDQI